jgi:hypothetical protein
MSDFLTWAKTKNLPIPVELQPALGKAPPSNSEDSLDVPPGEYLIGWNSICDAIETRSGLKLGKGDNRRRNTVRLMKRYKIAWERKSAGEWVSAQDGTSTKGGPVRLRKSLLVKLPSAPTADPPP